MRNTPTIPSFLTTFYHYVGPVSNVVCQQNGNRRQKASELVRLLFVQVLWAYSMARHTLTLIELQLFDALTVCVCPLSDLSTSLPVMLGSAGREADRSGSAIWYVVRTWCLFKADKGEEQKKTRGRGSGSVAWWDRDEERKKFYNKNKKNPKKPHKHKIE